MGRPGHHEYVDASDELKGLGRNEGLATEQMAYLKSDLFISSARFSIEPADIVTVRLPPIRVNASNKLIEPIVFRRIEKTAVYACVQ